MMVAEQPVDPPAEQPTPTAEQPVQPVEPTVSPSPAPIVPETSGGGGKKFAFVVVIVLVLAIGAVVAGFVSARKSRQAKLGQDQGTTIAETTEDSLTTQYGQMSESDEISAIEADLENTSFDGIDKELAEIDKELSNQD